MKISHTYEAKIDKLLNEMTLEEKIGQLSLRNSWGESIPHQTRIDLINGRIGAILNEVNLDTINELQRIAVQESRLKIPLLFGRDIIHGFKTVFPIPLGQAASWDPELVESCAHISAIEAASQGINWTFAPMIDISRDPRWGRIAESLGEDPYLTSILGKAMVKGFQGDDFSKPGNIAACAKHFAGYGASESGKDYNVTNIPENELRNVYLIPFKAVVDAGIVSLMTSFSDLNGIPASANEWLLKKVLRDEWKFKGFVVSDWDSIKILSKHGLTTNDKESAFEAVSSGLDMEMASTTYAEYIPSLVEENKISIKQIDLMVKNVLRIKYKLGLFENPYTDPKIFPTIANEEHLALAKKAAIRSTVLLKNNNVLPIDKKEINSIAILGPLADDEYEQLGTWIFDGDPQLSQTPLNAIKQFVGDNIEVNYVRAMNTSRSHSSEHFEEALETARNSDLIILFLGEESILSGEAHCRTNIKLPGNQEDLIKEVSKLGKPTVLVILAGRPLALENILDDVDAILYCFHLGSMAGPAISDLLFGIESPSGKLPVTFPRVTGQIPIYYSHRNTGKPATPESFIHIDNINPRATQLSVGNTSLHLDTYFTPLFPFGYGKSYTNFEYSNIHISAKEIKIGDNIEISAELSNTGNYTAEEVVQLYIRDLVGSVTRPVKELKGFKKIKLNPGEKKKIVFTLNTDDLAFYNRKMKLTTEPGKFHVWIGESSDADLWTEFEILRTD